MIGWNGPMPPIWGHRAGRLLAVLAAGQQGRAPQPKPLKASRTPPCSFINRHIDGLESNPAGSILSFIGAGFRALRLRPGPCGLGPLSYMRLTVAISRVFDLKGVLDRAP